MWPGRKSADSRESPRIHESASKNFTFRDRFQDPWLFAMEAQISYLPHPSRSSSFMRYHIRLVLSFLWILLDRLWRFPQIGRCNSLLTRFISSCDHKSLHLGLHSTDYSIRAMIPSMFSSRIAFGWKNFTVISCTYVKDESSPTALHECMRGRLIDEFLSMIEDDYKVLSGFESKMPEYALWEIASFHANIKSDRRFLVENNSRGFTVLYGFIIFHRGARWPNGQCFGILLRCCNILSYT